MKTCEVCGGEFKNLGAHMRKHKEIDNGLQERPKVPKWRKQTPVFGPGQAGIRLPWNKIERGWK